MAANDEPDPDADCFKPPAVPTEVHCLHCGKEYESYLMEYRIEQDPDGTRHGFWCCGTPGCDGKGFGFDIFPTDPDYTDADGEKMWCDDGDGEEFFGESDEDDAPFNPDDMIAYDPGPAFNAEKEMEEILKDVDDSLPANEEDEEEEEEEGT